MIKINDKIKVKITNIKHYGFFFITSDNIKGLVHISEISDKYVYDINDSFKVDDEVEIVVIDYDETKNQIKGSYKKATNLEIKEKNFYSKDEFKSLKDKIPSLIKDKMKEIKSDD